MRRHAASLIGQVAKYSEKLVRQGPSSYALLASTRSRGSVVTWGQDSLGGDSLSTSTWFRMDAITSDSSIRSWVVRLSLVDGSTSRAA